MKCRAQTYKYHTDPCNNEGAVDGYCYLHHPEVMLAKFRFQLRAGWKPHAWRFSAEELRARIAEQKALLAAIPEHSVALSPRMDAAIAADSPATPGGSARLDRVVILP